MQNIGPINRKKPSIDNDSRRRAIRLTYLNGFLWAIGNGLVATTLVIFLASELGAKGLAISLILASPRLVGVLRLGVPALVAKLAPSGFGRKGLCIATYIASGVSLVFVPFAAIGVGQYDQGWGIAALVASWGIYHLLEFTATVTLWSWIGDIYPAKRRSLLLGHRERWLVIGRILGLTVSILLASVWSWLLPDAKKWIPLAVSASLGAIFLILAVIPLVLMPAMATSRSATPQAPWRTLLQAFMEKPYRRLLTYISWFGIANGLTMTAQSLYPIRILQFQYQDISLMRIGMRIGQSALAPWCGRFIASNGAKRLLIPCQLLVAVGPLFYLFATPDQRWWLIGAYLVWIAYAGINVGLDSLKLGLSDPDNNGPFVAVYHSVSDLSNAVSTIIGGIIYDALGQEDQEYVLKLYACLFVAGWIVRSMSVICINRLLDNRTLANLDPAGLE